MPLLRTGCSSPLEDVESDRLTSRGSLGASGDASGATPPSTGTAGAAAAAGAAASAPATIATSTAALIALEAPPVAATAGADFLCMLQRLEFSGNMAAKPQTVGISIVSRLTHVEQQ